MSCYESIDELPMRIFIECLTKRAFTLLVKSGTATEAQLSEVWLHLYSQYLERIQDSNIDAFLDRKKMINGLTSRLSRMQRLLEIAQVVASEEIAAAFRAEGFTLDMEADEEQYFQQLRVINAKLKPESMRLDRLISEQDSEQEKSEITHGTFISLMMDISKHEGFRIRIDELTVGEYCAYFLRLRDHREAQMKAANKQVA